MVYDTKNYISQWIYKTCTFLKTQAFVCYMIGPSGVYKYLTKTKDLEATLSDDCKMLTIPYKKNNQLYSITVPYSTMNILPMTDFKVVLKKGDSDSIDITQQPGIPYLSSASELGGESIIVTNPFADISERFTGKDRPGFVYKLHLNE